MKQRRVILWSVVLMLLLHLSGTCGAGEEALYGPQAPAGSAFIRLFNATPAARIEARLGPVQLRVEAAYTASAYAFLPPGPGTLKADGRSLAVNLAADRSYTAVLFADRLVLISDPVMGNRKKALLVLYNLTGSDHVSVRTRKKNRTVLGETAALSCSARGVNPVGVELDVYDGKSLLSRVPRVVFERGRMFSLFVCGDRTAPVAVWVENSARQGQG